MLHPVQNVKKERSTRSRFQSNSKHIGTGASPTNPNASLPLAPAIKPDKHDQLTPTPAGLQDFAGSNRRDASFKYGVPPAAAADSLAGPGGKATQPELTTPDASAATSPPAARVQAGGEDVADAADVAAVVQKQILSGGGCDLEALLAYVRSGRL